MVFTYSAEQWLPYAIERVFAFFANPDNLPKLMPGWQDARIDRAALSESPAHSLPIAGKVAGVGSRITMSFRPVPLVPFRLSWLAEISEFVWNDHFCDVQVRGPFAHWNHCHSLRAEDRETSGTLLRDVVEYKLPLGAIGALAQPAIAMQLKATFAFRHKRTEELLAQG